MPAIPFAGTEAEEDFILDQGFKDISSSQWEQRGGRSLLCSLFISLMLRKQRQYQKHS